MNSSSPHHQLEEDTSVVRRLRKIGATTRLLYFALSAIAIFDASSHFRRFLFLRRLENGTIDFSASKAAQLDTNVSTTTWMFVGCGAVTFILLIMWLRNLTVLLRRRGAAFTRSNGWVIGGFFVPIGNFYLPYVFLKENLVHQISVGKCNSRTTKHLNIFWWSWMAMWLTDRYATYAPTETLAQLTQLDGLAVFSALIAAVASFFGAQMIEAMTPAMSTTDDMARNA